MNTHVPPEGPQNARMMFIGEAPGADEVRLGRPFVGPAGKVLDQLLADVGIKRPEVYITNVMKVRPPGNKFETFFLDKACTQPSPELVAGIDALEQEIHNIPCGMIICLGAWPLWALTGLRGIEKYRGFPHRAMHRNIIATYHPAYILRQWSGYPTAKMDFEKAKKIQELYEEETPICPMNLISEPTFGQALDYLEACKRARRISYDVETAQGMIDCIGFSRGESTALCIPMAMEAGDGSYWTEQQEILLWRKIKEVLESGVPIVGQNISYDNFYVQTTRGITPKNIELDTMIAFNLMYPGQSKGLDYLATVYTNHPYWGYRAPKVLGPERWKYNAMDCLVTHDIAEPIIHELRTEGHYDFYHRLPHKLIKPLEAMTLRGVRIDRDLRNRTRASYRKRIGALKKGVQGTLGGEDIEKAQASIKSLKKVERGSFNPGSDTQLRNLVYDTWGMKKIFERGTKSPKIDESALRRLAEEDEGAHGRFFPYLLQYNKLDKLYTTYLSADIGPDGRMRCSYNIAGTVTGRLSSSAAPDRTGTNLQNIPHGDMRRMFIADEGYVILKCDIKQADNTVVAYLANEPFLIKAFEEGADVHKRVASMIFNKAEHRITKQERKLGKKSGHAMNYGEGVDMFRQVCWEEMGLRFTRREAERIRNGYLDICPRISMWHLEIQEQLGKNRTLVNPFGRKRYFFERWGNELFKQAYAHLPQSTVVDVLDTGLISLFDAGYDLLLQVHDELDMNGKADPETLRAIKSHMEFTITINGHSVVLPIEISAGKNWEDMREVSDG